MEFDPVAQKLKILGLKTTSIRKNILNLLEHAQTPISATEILTRVKANKTTVYRELEVLLNHGLLNVINLGDGFKRYEIATREHHHHLVCLKCKSVTELDIADDFTKEEALIAIQKNFQVIRHALEFFGLCQNCHN